MRPVQNGFDVLLQKYVVSESTKIWEIDSDQPNPVLAVQEDAKL